MTFPISCGPGSIAAAITVGVALNDTRLSLSLARMGGGVLALLTIGLLLYLAFRYAQQLLKPLGEAYSVICVCRPSSCCVWACRSFGMGSASCCSVCCCK